MGDSTRHHPRAAEENAASAPIKEAGNQKKRKEGRPGEERSRRQRVKKVGREKKQKKTPINFGASSMGDRKAAGGVSEGTKLSLRKRKDVGWTEEKRKGPAKKKKKEKISKKQAASNRLLKERGTHQRSPKKKKRRDGFNMSYRGPACSIIRNACCLVLDDATGA